MMLTLQEEETIIATVRKHWLVFTLDALGLLVVAILPLVLPFAVPGELTATILPGAVRAEVEGILTFAAILWAFIMFLLFMVTLTNYYLDMLVVTNKRIIDIDQKHLFARDIATLPIEQMQDVKIEVPGVLAELFRFGNLYIQTAGGVKEFEIRGIRHPQKVQELIMNAYRAGTDESP